MKWKYLLTIPLFKVEYGKGYKVRLELNNDNMYESAYDTIYPVPEPTSINLDKVQQENFNIDGTIELIDLISFSVNTPISVDNNAQKTYFLWEWESVYKQSDTPQMGAECVVPSCLKTSNEPKTCFLSINPVRNYKVLDGNSLSGDSIEDFILFEDAAATATFSEGYYITILQQSVSKTTYDYL